MSQVNVHDLWPYAGLPCCVGILSICPYNFLSHSMQELFQIFSTIWKCQFYHPFAFRRQTCFSVQRAEGRCGGGGVIQSISQNLSNFLTSIYTLPCIWTKSVCSCSAEALSVFWTLSPPFRQESLLLDISVIVSLQE